MTFSAVETAAEIRQALQAAHVEAWVYVEHGDEGIAVVTKGNAAELIAAAEIARNHHGQFPVRCWPAAEAA